MDLVTIGKISGTHHLKGAVKANLNIGDETTLLNEKILIEKTNGEKTILTVSKISKLLGDKYTLEFVEVPTKTEANLLHGATIKINRNILGLSEDEYLLEDLLDMEVFLENNEKIGVVTEVFDTAAHDIIVVEDDDYEVMIPNVDAFVKNIDFENKKIIVEVWEGMRELKNKEK